MYFGPILSLIMIYTPVLISQKEYCDHYVQKYNQSWLFPPLHTVSFRWATKRLWWEAICWYGLGPLSLFKGRITAKQFIHIDSSHILLMHSKVNDCPRNRQRWQTNQDVLFSMFITIHTFHIWPSDPRWPCPDSDVAELVMSSPRPWPSTFHFLLSISVQSGCKGKCVTIIYEYNIWYTSNHCNF